MTRPSYPLLIASLILVGLAFAPALVAEDLPPPGRYEGTLVLPGASLPMVLTLLDGGGGLVDLPSQDIYGYPLSGLEVGPEGTVFSLGSPGSGTGYLRFVVHAVPGAQGLVPGASAPSAGSLELAGTFAGASQEGEVHLASAAAPATDDLAVDLPVKGGLLRGSLLLPPGVDRPPLVILVSGAGASDRNGNNYAVPGRNDGLKALAYALRDLGVATYRYDKRGAGESYVLAGPEEDSRFDDYIEDAEAVVGFFRGDGRFSGLTVAGHTEGALVAAAALNALGRDADGRLPRLALLCASGRSAVEVVEAALADTPPDLVEEGRAIMEALKEGKPYPGPSSYFAEFFRPSFQAYLSSWFRRDLVAELKAFDGEVVIIQGNLDVQVSLAEVRPLAAARPEVPVFLLPVMNHVLKAVSNELDDNYRAFSDPAYPLAPGLAAILAAFASGKDLPADLPRVGPSAPAATEDPAAPPAAPAP